MLLASRYRNGVCPSGQGGCGSSFTEASIFGTATIDGTGPHFFQIDVKDLGEPGKGTDTYRMRTTAYDSGENTLQAGNVNIKRTS